MTSQLITGILSRSRVHLVRQAQIAECGLACIAMVATFHGLAVDMATLRRRFVPSARGASFKSMIAVADRLQLAGRALKLSLDALPSLQMPAILHWNLNHFVVVERADRSGAMIHDPDKGSRWLPTAELARHFTGVALELQPTPDFSPGDERQRLRLSQLWQRMTGLKRALLQTVLLSMMLEVFVVASPYYMQFALDVALPARDVDLLTLLAAGFGLFAVINAGASLLRSFVLLSAGMGVGYGISVNVARRLFRLPVDWFEKRTIGDVIWRFQSIVPIQQMLTQGAVAGMIDGLFAVFTLTLMAFYSPSLTMLALVALALYSAVRVGSFSAQKTAQEQVLVAGGRENSLLVETLRGIVTLRMFNMEAQRHAAWQSRLTDFFNAQIGVSRIGIWQETTNLLIFSLETVASVWIAVHFVMDRTGFTIGMVFAFMAYKAQFLAKATSLVDKVAAFRMLRVHLERLADIALADEDHGFRSTASDTEAFSGRIELRGIRYRYSESDPWVLDGVNLTLAPGAHVAITGPSGGGKSTLVKILSGLVEPTAGELLVNGLPVRQFGHRQFQSQVGTVLQEDTLFAGSLAENIMMFDEEGDMEDVVRAATAASIHEDILRMPMRYDSLVGDMGSALSGGQKQRVLLARALYRGPRLLIVDEGTAHLDAWHEKNVNDAISRMGITRIIVAHRAETLANAETVYELVNGTLSLVREGRKTAARLDDEGAPPKREGAGAL